MRSKEVSEAIDKLTIAQNNLLEATLYSQEEQDEDIKTVLAYISELEKLPNKIKDKIKFLENKAKEYGYYKTEIEYARNTLQEIIGE